MDQRVESICVKVLNLSVTFQEKMAKDSLVCTYFRMAYRPPYHRLIISLTPKWNERNSI